MRPTPSAWSSSSVLAFALSLSGACDSSVDLSLESKQCSRSGECLRGYVCSEDRICVRRAETREEPGKIDPDAATVDGDAASQTPGVITPPPSGVGCAAADRCNGICVDRTTDVDNCGECGSYCPAAQHGRPTCDEGRCGLRCEDGYVQCGSTCAKLDDDPLHCGGCGVACPTPQNGAATCAAGSCGVTCTSGFTPCGAQCVRLDVDPLSCGACNNSCSVDEQCSGSVCVRACPAGTAACARSCVDVQNDPLNCGGCGQACSGPPKSELLCQQGVCAWQCEAGLTNCNGACVDVSSDPAQCGACGNACPPDPQRGTSSCAAGACTVTCEANYMNCDQLCVSTTLLQAARASGFDQAPCTAIQRYETWLRCQALGQNFTACEGECVILATSNEHCGMCGRACEPSQRCLRGTCLDVSF